MSEIHPSAVIHPDAAIGDDCEVGPYCIIGRHVTLGQANRLHSHVVIDGHTDIGIGMNAKTEHPEQAKEFLAWVASPEFAAIFGNALPGFFPLSETPVEIEDPLAQEFASWRQECNSTIRSTYQILSRGTPNLENETWNASAQVIKGTETPSDAGARLQEGLASWYEPKP